MAKLNKQETWIVKKIKQERKRQALGYEEDHAFTHGMIVGFLRAKLISRRFYNELVENFVYSDGEPEELDDIEAIYGRILC